MRTKGPQIELEMVGGTSLVVQWLRLQVPNAGSLGSVPDQGKRSHRQQIRAHMLQLKMLCATTKTQRS